jgi:parallel beta-helix repeat protein
VQPYKERKMKIKILLLLTIFGNQICKATDYYVSNSGLNSNDGLSVATPFNTVTYASTIANHGDTIFVMPGVYKNTTYGTWDIWKTEQAVRINNKNSTSGSYLVIKPQIAGTVKFKSDGNFIIQIRNSSYIRIEGFEIEGELDNVSLNTALQYQFTYKDANGDIQERVPAGTPSSTIATMTFPILTGTTRPSIFNSDALIAQNSHHIDILNNTIRKSTSAGIRIASCDYVNVINNIISDCNHRTSVGTPALVLSLINSIDNNDNTKIVIARNKVYDNFNLVFSWNALKNFITPEIDEGKGISLEHCITRTSPEPSWNHGRVLIENNICYGNGFSGINTNEAERVDVINNTCYQNIASGRGGNTGISINDTYDANVINNISYSINTFGGYALAIRNSSLLNFSNNLVNGTIDADVIAIDEGTIFADPLFVDTNEFKLISSSKAIDASINVVAPTIDYYGNLRDSNKDRGAVEFIDPLSTNDFEYVNNLKIYPNPTANTINIENYNSENLQLIGINGQNYINFASKNKTDTSIKLNLENLSNGIYILKIENKIVKIIKNHQ